MRDSGFPFPDVAQKTIYDDDEPVAQADFFYEDADRPQPIVVFVDGPDHQKEHAERDDSAKRKRLLGLGYRVVSISDPADVSEVWDRI